MASLKDITVDIYLAVAITIAACAIVGVLFNHRFKAGTVVGGLQAKAATEVTKLENTAEADALAALLKLSAWLTDSGAETQMRADAAALLAAADASTARKAALRQHVAATFTAAP